MKRIEVELNEEQDEHLDWLSRQLQIPPRTSCDWRLRGSNSIKSSCGRHSENAAGTAISFTMTNGRDLTPSGKHGR